MNKDLLLLLSILLTIGACSPKYASKTNGKAIELFNGKDLSGWVVHGTEKWYVENGDLVCESGPDKQYGYLATENSYKNIDLSVDFKQETNGDSGVFFRSSLEGTKITGWQAEVDQKADEMAGIYESYGRGWLIKPNEEEVKKVFRPGDWNTLRVKVVGDEVTTWLNGKELVNLKDDKIGQAIGQIALQIHDGGGVKVRWKNIRLKVLN